MNKIIDTKAAEMTRRQFVRYTAGPVLLLSTGHLLTACGGSDSGDSASPSTFVFGALHPSGDHPLVRELLSLSATFQTGIGQEQHGLMVDAAKITATELEASRVIREYILADKAILLLNCTGEHKKALVKHIGISIGNDTSAAYFILPKAGSQGRHLAIHDHPRARVTSSAEFAQAFQNSDMPMELDNVQFQADQEQFRSNIENVIGPKEFAATIMQAVTANAALLGKLGGSSKSGAQPKQMVWTYNPSVTWHYANIWYQGSTVGNKWGTAAPPMQGYQEGTVSPTIVISLYLNNAASNATGSFQYLVVDHQGASNPVTGHSSEVSYKSVAMPINGKKYPVAVGTQLENMQVWAYAQMAYNFNFAPAFSNPASILHFVSAQPPNENKVTTYSSGYSFDVGFSSEGIDAVASVDHSTDTEIPDWAVDNTSNNATLNYNWNWHSANPLNTSDYNKINTLNTALFQPNSSCVMMTKSLQTQPLLFTMSYGVTQISWEGVLSFGTNFGRKDIGTCLTTQSISIDFGSVLNPVMESLSISPNQVKGGLTTTGTVTLDSNAPAGGTTVYLFSSNATWASVPTTVTVPSGVASQTFAITSYTVAGNSTVTIKASLTNVTNSASVSDTLTVTP